MLLELRTLSIFWALVVLIEQQFDKNKGEERRGRVAANSHSPGIKSRTSRQTVFAFGAPALPTEPHGAQDFGI